MATFRSSGSRRVQLDPAVLNRVGVPELVLVPTSAQKQLSRPAWLMSMTSGEVWF